MDIELWGAGDEALVGGTLSRMVGSCVIGVAELLGPTGHLDPIKASVPVTVGGGLVTGNVRVTVEARPVPSDMGLPV